MHHAHRLKWLAATALAIAVPSAAFAQTTSPMPAAPTTSAPMPSTPASPAATNAPASSAPASAAPATTSTTAPTTTSTTAPASSGATRSTQPTQRSTDVTPGGAAPGQVKKIQSGTLSRGQVVYGLTHQVQAAKQLLKMKTVNFDNLRVYKLPTSLQSTLKVSDADTQRITIALLGDGVPYAQATGAPLPSSNGNNSPIQYLRNVLANINVSNALNNLNVLNGSNVNVNVALSNVLNNNKISIGQVVGLYIGGGGIITTITK